MSDESLDLLLNVLLGNDSVSKFQRGMISIEDALKGVDQEAVDLANTFANDLDKRLKDLDNQFARTKKSIEGMKQSAEKLGAISQTLFVAGSAIVGGMYLSAKKEADRIIKAGGEVDAVTARWIAANGRIEAAQQKIGASAEAAVVPVLEKVASLAEMAATFVDKNPGLVSAGLKIGIWTAGIGAIGIAVSKGIKLAADIKYLAATAQFTIDAGIIKSASVQMFEAALLIQAKGGEVGGLGTVAQSILPVGNTPTPAIAKPSGLTGAAATLGNVTLIATALYIGAELGTMLGNAIARKIYGKDYKDQGLADAALTATRIFRLPAKAASAGLDAVGLDKAAQALDAMTTKADDFTKNMLGLGDATAAASDETDGLKSNLEDEATAMKKMTDLANENAKAERKYADDREKILTDASRSLADANRSLEKNLRDIAGSLGSNVRRINTGLRSTLAELSTNFTAANVQAEREYQSQRAGIITSGNDEVKKIQQQAKKDLEDLERQHASTLTGLIANRDALGIVNENNAYAEKQAEIKRNAEESIAQARANTIAQLAEAAQNYAEQRAQRLAEYQLQKEEAKAKAAAEIAEAKAQAAEDRKRAIAAAAEEKATIERKRNEQLADLKKSYDRERSERITAVYNEITELKGALNAEMLMRRTYQNQILADTTAHMQAMARAQTGSTPTKPTNSTTTTSTRTTTTGTRGGKPTSTHDYSGYAYTGMYAMAQDGQREYVLSGAATKAAEQMVGGQLNQQILLSGLAGESNSMQYIDNASYSGITVAERRKLRNESRREAVNVMSKAFRR